MEELKWARSSHGSSGLEIQCPVEILAELLQKFTPIKLTSALRLPSTESGVLVRV